MTTSRLAAFILFASVAAGAYGQQGRTVHALAYDPQTRGPVPIPPPERGLQTVVAEPWFKVSPAGIVLEGAAFERDGNLLFCDVSGGRVMRLTPAKHLSTVVRLQDLSPGGLAIQKEGRIFIAAMNLAKATGSLVAVNPAGTGMQTVVPPAAGYMPNDLVFDRRGGIYFTDFRGISTEPKGGVYYVSPDFKTIKPMIRRLTEALTCFAVPVMQMPGAATEKMLVFYSTLAECGGRFTGNTEITERNFRRFGVPFLRNLRPPSTCRPPRCERHREMILLQV